MKNKYEAVKEKTPHGDTTGWTIKTYKNKVWWTVCDVWAGPSGMNAEERAKEVAALMNKASEALFDKRVTVKIKDCDGDHYGDLYFNAPVGMNEKKAVQLVNKAIRKVQGKFHADYTFDDLELALTELGFDSTSFAVADERW